MGGGSAQLTPHPVTNPVDALRDILGAGIDVVHEAGCSIRRSASPLGRGAMTAAGFTLEILDHSAPEPRVAHTSLMSTAEFLFLGPPPGATATWSARVSGQVLPTFSGQVTLTLAQLGRARVFADGELVLDGVENPPPPGGPDFMGFGSVELCADLTVTAGEPVDVLIEYEPGEAAGLFAAKAGFRTPDSDEVFARAVTAARDADVAVLVVGTTGEWERETYDRPSMALPGRQDELVRAVAAVNPNTVVVVNAGSPVDMPWADDVNAIIQCWFGGQDLAGALADVLAGTREPGGRLPTTIPLRIEHNPSHDNFPGENGELRYGEGLFMGYRGYDHRALPVRYPFGHGLGYTTFVIDEPQLSAPVHPRNGLTTVSVTLTNTGDRRGSEVVQLYVAPVTPRLARPPKELKAFAKVTLEPGESATVDLALDDRAFAYWDPGQAEWTRVQERLRAFPGAHAAAERREPGWQVDAGRYALLVARSAADAVHTLTVAIED
jgi:beta-glucosidase